MGDKKGIILILFVCLVSVSFISAWADNTSSYQEVDGCNLLNTTGANYVLTGNVTSTATCFTFNAQNITLDCNGSWITYSTGGAGSTYGVYTNQFNTTIKNCNILDGNWGSADTDRYGIYFNGNDNSTLLNSFVNTSKSVAVYLNSNSNYNNLTFVNISSNSSFGIYVFLSLDNTFENLNVNSNNSNDIYFYIGSTLNCNNTLNNVRGKDGKLIIYIKEVPLNIDNFVESMLIICNANFSNITNSNFTTSGISLYYSNNNNFSNILASNNLNSAIMIQSSSNNSFVNITANNINSSGVGINLYSNSNFNTFSSIIANSKSNTGLRLYRSSNNTFSNASISSSTSRGIMLEDNCNFNNFSNMDIKSNTGYGIYLVSSSNNILLNTSVISNTSYGMYIYSSSKFNKLDNLTIISNISNVLYVSLDSDSNSIINSTLISLNKNGTLVYLTSNSNGNIFYGNNFTETSGYYVQDLNGSNYYNTTINGKGEGNIWNDILNGSVNIKGNVFSTLNPSLYIGEYGTDYPYNSTNSFGKISGNVVDYAPLTNNPVPISCGVLSEAGKTYTLTQNVSSTGTCFNITAQNITLDCNGNWITYSTGGLEDNYGIYTDQFNSTIKNCNIIDGNLGSVEVTRYGIYLNSSNNSFLFNNFVNVSNSVAILFNNGANFNNLTSNTANSKTYYGIYLKKSHNNSVFNFITTSSVGITTSDAENNTIINVNATGIDEYGIGIWLYQGRHNYFSNINSLGTDGWAIGIILQESDYNHFFNLNSNCTIPEGVFSQGIYLYNGSYNDFTNVSFSCEYVGMGIEASNYNNFTNIKGNGENYGIYLWESSYNRLSNVNTTSNTYYGFSFGSNSRFNILNEVKIISNLNISLGFKENSSSNVVANSTIISSNKQEKLLNMDSSCGFNTFYGNNFTETSGYYVQDLNGSNYYNTTINGKGEGNIWYDVMNSSVDISGSIYSTLYPSLYIGEYGTGYPYNRTNSFGKLSGNVVDYAPLTNQFEDSISPTYSSVSHNSTYANQASIFSININDETALNPNGQYIFSTNNSGSWVNESAVNFGSTPQLLSVTKTLNSNVGTVIGYMWYFNDSAGNMNSTSVYRLTTIAVPVTPPSGGGGSGGGSTSIPIQTQYQLGREFSEQGESLKLRKNYEVGFRHRQQSHTLTLNSFDSRTARITIRSDPITATLEKDVAQSFDLEGDSNSDIEITYQGTSGGEAQFFVKKFVLVSGESEVFVNSEGGEVKETETSQVSTNELFGTTGSTSSNVEKPRKDKVKHPLRTVLISLIVMGAIIVGLAVIGRNEKKKKEHYLGFFDK